MNSVLLNEYIPIISMVVCCRCKVELVEENWYGCDRKNQHNICKLCQKASVKKYLLIHPDVYAKMLRSITERRRNTRKKVLEHYSNGTMKCAKCGYNKDERALQIDHINGGGTKQEKTLTVSSISIWLVKNNFPDGFQILCANCNAIKARGEN